MTPKVLVIDDEEDIRIVARIALARIGGMEVIEASSGEAGIEAARAHAPDGVLLDVMMPGLDGPETLARLRADPATAHLPVIFLTAKAMTGEIDRLKALGAADVLTKPFEPRALAERVRALLSATPPDPPPPRPR